MRYKSENERYIVKVGENEYVWMTSPLVLTLNKHNAKRMTYNKAVLVAKAVKDSVNKSCVCEEYEPKQYI